jgi:tetratricopeptide (TPR) repeat protein
MRPNRPTNVNLERMNTFSARDRSVSVGACRFFPATYGNTRPCGVSHHVSRPPTEKPLARAEAHLQAGRVARAAGAFRAVLLIDPAEVQAHFGLAECALARDCADEAVAGLVASAAELAAGGRIEAALQLHAGALTIDPSRLELHLEVAELEVASGRDIAAAARLRALARAYVAAGRSDDASAIEEFVASDFPKEPLPSDESLIVELPIAASASADLPLTSAASCRHLRRAAVRWQPGGSPGRPSRPPPPPTARLRPPARPLPLPPAAPIATPPPVVSPPARAAAPKQIARPTPVPAKKIPTAPSALAQRLRMRSGSIPKAAPAPTREQLKQRLAASLAAVTAKHAATRQARPSHPGKASAPALAGDFEEERTQLFRRPSRTMA